MRIICRELQNAWQALSVEFQFEQRQLLAQVQQLMPAEEKMLCLSFEVIMKDYQGTMSVAVPSVISSALLRKLEVTRPRFYTRLRGADSPGQLRNLLLGCSFRLELGPAVSALSTDLTELSPGKVLTFGHKAGDVAELFAEGKPYLPGETRAPGQ
jgi:flagellar motor switch protein FliM